MLVINGELQILGKVASIKSLMCNRLWEGVEERRDGVQGSFRAVGTAGGGVSDRTAYLRSRNVMRRKKERNKVGTGGSKQFIRHGLGHHLFHLIIRQ